MKKITVLIVDDSALIRSLFSELLNSEPDITVIGTAVSSQDAREKIKTLNPDVVTLDIEMPGMDGLAFLEKIMTLRPMPVIMVSTLTQKGASATIRALELGAVDYVSKPAGKLIQNSAGKLKEELASKIRVAAQAHIAPRVRTVTKDTQSTPLPFALPANTPLPLIAIGASTGGVEALRDIFKLLPANTPPVVIVQHMSEQFTPSFAARLNSVSQVEVTEARSGMRLEVGHAYLAPGGRHLKVTKNKQDWVCQIEISPTVSGHRPSVDVLFQSVAEVAGRNAIGVILTGMGRDGATGLLKMHQAGAYTIGQNQNSCVVYGMPRAAMADGAVDVELPLADIVGHILTACSQERRTKHVS